MRYNIFKIARLQVEFILGKIRFIIVERSPNAVSSSRKCYKRTRVKQSDHQAYVIGFSWTANYFKRFWCILDIYIQTHYGREILNVCNSFALHKFFFFETNIIHQLIVLKNSKCVIIFLRLRIPRINVDHKNHKISVKFFLFYIQLLGTAGTYV